MIKHSVYVLAGVSALFLVGAAQGQTTLYVDDDAAGGGDGLSWSSAFDHVQDALDLAAQAKSGVNEVRVAQGRYVPTKRTDETDPRSVTFTLLNGVMLAGGYAGVGADDPDARDVEQFQTILSGDINGDDGPDFANNSENSYHVLAASGTESSAVLDGFLVREGNANIGDDWPTSTMLGGGLFAVSGSPTVRNCRFSSNWAKWGGAIYVREASSLSVIDCEFLANASAYDGSALRARGPGVFANVVNSSFVNNSGAAAMAVVEGDGSISQCAFQDNPNGGLRLDSSGTLEVFGSVFAANAADVGGAVRVNGPCSFKNCQFRDNSSWIAGGAVRLSEEGGASFESCEFTGNECTWMGGAIWMGTGRSVQVINCSFSDNEASLGGAFFNPGHLTLINCTLSENVGGGVFIVDAPDVPVATLTVKNSIVWGNQPFEIGNGEVDPDPPPPPSLTDSIMVVFSNIGGGWIGEGNVDANPLFVQTGCDDLRLEDGSPCLDAGNNGLIPAGVTTDLDGQPRIMNGTVAMGAYEAPQEPAPPAACEDDLDQGEFIGLTPLGPAPLLEHARIRTHNVAGPDNSSVSVAQFDEPLHEGAGGFAEMGA
ncbi:MAG: right-handed parallel beta-helix repeat-containing protein, partial [Phycisphaerales bacterium]|nr:right-handed parallel beta-helix repeat-containing protein [Phycisphaerales bacterium]MCI0676078.1 right-handed parallel beta-helix repeat-containing protein [Phycisphaerales bacterium]